MGGWREFAAAFAVFLLSHALPARPAVRRKLAGPLGEREPEQLRPEGPELLGVDAVDDDLTEGDGHESEPSPVLGPFALLSARRRRVEARAADCRPGCEGQKFR